MYLHMLGKKIKSTGQGARLKAGSLTVNTAHVKFEVNERKREAKIIDI